MKAIILLLTIIFISFVIGCTSMRVASGISECRKSYQLSLYECDKRFVRWSDQNTCSFKTNDEAAVAAIAWYDQQINSLIGDYGKCYSRVMYPELIKDDKESSTKIAMAVAEATADDDKAQLKAEYEKHRPALEEKIREITRFYRGNYCK